MGALTKIWEENLGSFERRIWGDLGGEFGGSEEDLEREFGGEFGETWEEDLGVFRTIC